MIQFNIVDRAGEDLNHPQYNSQFTESVSGAVRKQNLNVWDVGALVLNKQIGAGALTTSASIFLANGSKGLTVGLWFLGGPYCLLCLLIYLDYGISFPFNGGELIYLNQIWPCPDLLQAFLFSSLFLTLGHDAGNAIAFARQVVLAYQNTTNPDFNAHLTKFIGVSILGLACLLLWVSPKTGLFLNKLLASYKIVLLLVVGSLGFAAGRHSCSNTFDTDWKGKSDSSGFFNSVMLIIYSYGGWENANYIIGDIKTKKKSLRNGAFGAVLIVMVLYTFLSAGLLSAVSYKSLEDTNSIGVDRSVGISPTETSEATCPSLSPLPPDIALIVLLSETSGIKISQRALEICIALSAAGNILAVAYTSSKAKQAIALHRFLPFWRFFARDDHFMTPGGALVLHFICTSIIIVVIPNTTAGYDLVASSFSYAQLFIGVFMGLGYPRLRHAVQRSGLDSTGWKTFVLSRRLIWFIGPLLASINLVLLVAAPVYGARKTTDTQYAGWLLPTILLSTQVLGLAYWCGFRLLIGPLGRYLDWTITLKHVEGLDELSQIQREQRRDGVEQYFQHELALEGKAQRTQNWFKRMAKWIENHA